MAASSPTATAYLLLGSNLGDRAATLHSALQHLNELAGRVVTTSALYETAAWGLEDQPPFLNQAVQLETALSPEQLLAACQQVEKLAGRERRKRWGARTLDVDILLYNNEILNTPDLIIPHPALPQRRFALVPLAEIAGGVVHPEMGKTISELLAICPDQLPVYLYVAFMRR